MKLVCGSRWILWKYKICYILWLNNSDLWKTIQLHVMQKHLCLLVYLTVFLARSNFLCSILSTDGKVKNSFSIGLKREEQTEIHVSNTWFSVSISSTEIKINNIILLPLKGKENKQSCTGGVANFRQRDIEIRFMLL